MITFPSPPRLRPATAPASVVNAYATNAARLDTMEQTTPQLLSQNHTSV